MTSIGEGEHTRDRYEYNEEGERTKATPEGGPANTYSYNAAEELTEVNRPATESAPAIADRYMYSGDGLRSVQETSGSKSYLAWEEAQGLPLLLSDGTNSYIYGPGELPIEQVSSGGTVTYLHHDQQGSTRLLTNGSGEVVGKCSYAVYGASTCTGTASTPMGYDGEYTNADTGLQDLRARNYDPTTGQFTSADPLSRWTHAPYGYGLDNPLRYDDPTGLLSFGDIVGGVEEGLDQGAKFVEEHPVAAGIALGVTAVATGGAALVVDGGVATATLGLVSAAAGTSASALDTGRCINGDTGACVGAGLGITSLGLGLPEALASRGFIQETDLFRALAGGGLVISGYGALSDLLTGAPNFLAPLLGCR